MPLAVQKQHTSTSQQEQARQKGREAKSSVSGIKCGGCKTMFTLLKVASQPATLGGPSTWIRRNPFRDGLQGSGGGFSAWQNQTHFPPFFFFLFSPPTLYRTPSELTQCKSVWASFIEWLICIDSPSLSNSTKWKTTGEHLGWLDFSQLAQNKINTFYNKESQCEQYRMKALNVFLSGETSRDPTAWGQIALPDHNSFQLWFDGYVFIGLGLSKAIPL